MSYLDTIRRIEEKVKVVPKDLPFPVPKLEAEQMTPAACGCCHRARFWESIYGVIVCATCHPPGHPALVARWVFDEQ